MKFKQVARLSRVFLRARRGAWRRVLHPLLVARIAATILMLPRTVGADGGAAYSAAPIAHLDAATAQSTESALAGVFRTQNTSGAYRPSEESKVLLSHPLFATMALDAYSTTHNTSVLALSANSISRYYGYLYSTADRDGDRLIETPATVNGRATSVEDPLFNAMIAIDARNLARINLELRRTMPALYWYDGARSIERAVVAGTFDAGDDYFFARDPSSRQPIRDFSPGAALPADFSMVVGENHAARVRSHVVEWCAHASMNVAPAERAANAFDLLAAISVLSDGNHAAVIDALRGAMPLPSSTSMAVERYALARSRMDIPLTDDDVVFGLLLNLERVADFSDGERFRIERALPKVRELALAPTTPAMTVPDAEDAIRTLYTTVSTVRERLRTTSFFGPDDRRAFPGVDPNIAAQRLLDDVTSLLHRAENRLFEMRYAAAGVRMRVELVNDTVVVRDQMNVRWEIGTTKSTLQWKQLSAGVFGEAVSPVTNVPLTAVPGKPIRFRTRQVARGSTGTLRMVTFTAVFKDPSGLLSRCHFDRTVYLNPPVAVSARFPQGRTMEASTIPVELRIHRYTTASAATKYFWFSPAGLRVTEGNTGAVRFGDADSAVVMLHVEVPSPCRPGVFPFTLKFFAGDRDAGTIASSLFKPYQWTFVGPFAPDGGLARAHPPERGVNLLQTYPGPNGEARWRPVPESACDPRGGIALRSLANDRGVQYLYTVVACAYETNLKAQLWSNSPAALYLNGRPIVTVAANDSAKASVRLDPDKNHILIKVLGDRDSQVSFVLGDNDNMAADEFNNDLSELAGGYRELTARELASGSEPSESRRLVTLRFHSTEATSVAVVGSFNGWSPASSPMRKQGDVWELTLSLAPGRYSYRFLVNDREQVLDPTSPATEPDGYGGRNSVLVVNQ